MDLLALNEQLRAEAAKVIVGQDEAFTQVLIALLSGGHVLLEGVPGVAKTLIAKTLARLVDTSFGRIQFTADLMPSDVIGTQVFDLNKAEFYLRKGPIFTNIVLADEINRAPAKTQSALLEAMEERQVSIDGTQHALGDPFMVLATQNPVEYEGTYPLPEAQLDRFLFKVVVGYPSEEQEKEILRRYHTGFDAHHLDRSGIAARHLRRRPAGHPRRDPGGDRGGGHPGLHHPDRQRHAPQPRPDSRRQPARGHRHAADGQDLRRAARARLRHARRRQGRAAAHLPPPPHPAPRSRDRGTRTPTRSCGASSPACRCRARRCRDDRPHLPTPGNCRRPGADHALIRTVGINPMGLKWQRFIVADERGRVVGAGQVKTHGDGARELASIAVAPDRQGMGIGRAIVATFVALEPDPLYLYCADHNEGYYLQFGFRALAPGEMPRSLRRIHRLGNGVLRLVSAVSGQPPPAGGHGARARSSVARRSAVSHAAHRSAILPDNHVAPIAEPSRVRRVAAAQADGSRRARAGRGRARAHRQADLPRRLADSRAALWKPTRRRSETCRREVAEELGLALPVGRLLCVEYLPAYDDYTESVQFVFDGGVMAAAVIRDSCACRRTSCPKRALWRPTKPVRLLNSRLAVRVCLRAGCTERRDRFIIWRAAWPGS